MHRKRIERAYRISKYIVYKETLVDYKEKFWSFLGSFLGIGLIAIIQSGYMSEYENLFLIGSFGASSVLVFGSIQSPLAQPRNLLGGHIVSAFIGVTVYQLLPNIIWLTAPLSVSLSIIAMQYTKTMHPPGGATALIAVTGTEQIKSLGYLYVVFPVFTGALILFFVAMVINNMTLHRNYPSGGRFLRYSNWFTEPLRNQSQKAKNKRIKFFHPK